MFAPIVDSLLNTLVFVSFNPECHPFHSDPHLMHPTFSSSLALPNMFFFNLYIFWMVQRPLGCFAPIVKSKFNFTNGGYGTLQKMPFPWIYKTNLQQPLTFFFIFTAIEVFYFYQISCLHVMFVSQLWWNVFVDQYLRVTKYKKKTFKCWTLTGKV